MTTIESASQGRRPPPSSERWSGCPGRRRRPGRPPPPPAREPSVPRGRAGRATRCRRTLGAALGLSGAQAVESALGGSRSAPRLPTRGEWRGRRARMSSSIPARVVAPSDSTCGVGRGACAARRWTSPSSTAQTSQRPWVMIRSGASRRSVSASTAMTGRPAARRRRTSASMAALERCRVDRSGGHSREAGDRRRIVALVGDPHEVLRRPQAPPRSRWRRAAA